MSILGNRVVRVEDPRFLTDGGRYVADLDLPDAVHAVFVRSNVAQGLIESVETSEAKSAPGIVGVFTAADLMESLRGAIWGELDEGTVTIDVYRRNLQRAFLETVERQLNPPPPGEASGRPGRRGGFGQQQPRWESDQRPVLRGELVKLDALAEAAIERAGNAMTRLHLRDIRMEIERILDGDD